MATRNIVKVGDDILRKKSRPVEKFDKRLWQLLDDMKETMYLANGVGLAAVQVGVLRRVVVLDCSQDRSG
jgi:peptide deformylase